MNIIPCSYDNTVFNWCLPCMYSNGFVNALVYGLQNKKVCSKRRVLVNGDALQAPAPALSPSFHVGFGPESCVSPQETIMSCTHPSLESENEERVLWTQYI